MKIIDMLTEFELLELENDFFTACSGLGWRYLAHWFWYSYLAN
jgi:hypothetical protein